MTYREYDNDVQVKKRETNHFWQPTANFFFHKWYTSNDLL